MLPSTTTGFCCFGWHHLLSHLSTGRRWLVRKAVAAAPTVQDVGRVWRWNTFAGNIRAKPGRHSSQAPFLLQEAHRTGIGQAFGAGSGRCLFTRTHFCDSTFCSGVWETCRQSVLPVTGTPCWTYVTHWHVFADWCKRRVIIEGHWLKGAMLHPPWECLRHGHDVWGHFSATAHLVPQWDLQTVLDGLICPLLCALCVCSAATWTALWTCGHPVSCLSAMACKLRGSTVSSASSSFMQSTGGGGYEPPHWEV